MLKASKQSLVDERDLENDRDQGHAAAVREEGDEYGSCSRLQQMTEKLRAPVR
jgi:hypothetical protein